MCFLLDFFFTPNQQSQEGFQRHLAPDISLFFFLFFQIYEDDCQLSVDCAVFLGAGKQKNKVELMFGQRLHLEVERETGIPVPQTTTRLTRGKRCELDTRAEPFGAVESSPRHVAPPPEVQAGGPFRHRDAGRSGCRLRAGCNSGLCFVGAPRCCRCSAARLSH